MKILNDVELLNLQQERNRLNEEAIAESAAIEDRIIKEQEDARLNEYLEASKFQTNASKLSNLRRSVKSELLEAALDTIFDKCFANTNYNNTEEDNNFNSAIVANFVDGEGVDDLLESYSTKTEFLSDLAKAVNEAADEAMEGVDPDNVDNAAIDSEPKEDLVTYIKGDENIDDISDVIRSNVSRATEDFVQKNINDKYDIKDIMTNTKEKIDAVKTDDEEVDEEIKQEHTMMAKKAIKALNKRPHSIFEQMVINMTEAVLSNDELRKSFTTEAGKLNMNKIIKRTTSYYTFLEMANTLKLTDVNEEYIREAVSLK